MSNDTHCRKCGEPWDIYGLTHGDVQPWQARAVKAGLGCPCCEANGVNPGEAYFAMEWKTPEDSEED